MTNTIAIILGLVYSLPGFAQTRPIPEDVIALIQQHQPYIKRSLLDLNYSKELLQQTYKNQIQWQNNTAIIEKTNNITIWEFDNQQLIKTVRFVFSVHNWEGAGAEKRLLAKHRKQLNVESILRAPSSTRSFTIKNSNYNLEIALPLNYTKPLTISSIELDR